MANAVTRIVVCGAMLTTMVAGCDSVQSSTAIPSTTASSSASASGSPVPAVERYVPKESMDTSMWITEERADFQFSMPESFQPMALETYLRQVADGGPTGKLDAERLEATLKFVAVDPSVHGGFLLIGHDPTEDESVDERATRLIATYPRAIADGAVDVGRMELPAGSAVRFRYPANDGRVAVQFDILGAGGQWELMVFVPRRDLARLEPTIDAMAMEFLIHGSGRASPSDPGPSSTP